MSDVEARSASEERQRRHVSEEWDAVAFGTHCVNCMPGDCPLYVYTKDGKVVREEAAGVIEPNEPGVPDMNPLVCQKGLGWSRELEGPERLLHPMRRSGERGEGRWERISWDEALSEVADAMLDAIEEVGPAAIVTEMSPEIVTVPPTARFTGILGVTVLDVDGTINDFFTGYQQVFGKFSFAASMDDLFHTELLLIWHSNPAHTVIPSFHFITEARYRGAEVALFSTDVNPSHSHVDYHVPVRHGSDAALALAMCQVIVSEGLVDRAFASSQTDLSLLVRTDTDEFLREGHVQEGGRDDRFFQLHPERGLVPAEPANLLLDFAPELEEGCEVKTLDAGTVLVEPLFARVRRLLDAHYTPEQASSVCEAHPETIRMLARKVASRRTRILLGAGVCKYFHGDLMTRSMLLMLGLTGNWGKKGAGVGGWCSSLFDGLSTVMGKTKPGVEGGKELLDGSRMIRDHLVAQDPSLTGELPDRELLKAVTSRSIVPPAFFWYEHAGYKERWNRSDWSDPTMVRKFDDYWREAIASKAWGEVADSTPLTPPRVLLEIGGNTLRRTRGGKKALLENLWPKLDKVVCMDYRMSQTALYADILLPATQHYEKTSFSMPTPWSMVLAMGQAVATPPGEARGEWQVLGDLCKKLAERAEARGLESYPHFSGETRRFDALWDAFTLSGTMADEESAAAAMLADAVTSGNMPQGTTLDTFRRKGHSRYADWSFIALAKANASPFPKNETHSPLRNHIEQGQPYPTLTRRAQFLIDHPWYREAGEDLPVHKEPPPMGGQHPFRLSGGHSRWSIHAMNMSSPLMLETHRGKPFALINEAAAREKGIEDDSLVRIWNDVGEFIVNARLSPAQRPDGLTVYNGFEGFMFPRGRGANEVEPGMVKWLHLVGDYGHLSYAPTEWQPVPFDRCINVDCEPFTGEL